ncbi:MAG: ABC transporter substrate-binding protein [Pseudomonadaceae bacterium]|nr:ABC transporter substrate-binding protein [Pseudomonadaceae bacterium]
MRASAVCLFSLMLLLTVGRVNAERLEVVADVWCPFNCQPDAPLPGYVVELLKAAFPDDSIDYRVLPWKRAILQARNGLSSAALAATQDMADEAHLQVGQQPIGYSYDCLYVAAGNDAKYQGHADDLNSLNRVGIALGYDYSEGLGEWLAHSGNKAKVFSESGDEPAARNLRKLSRSQLDGMIEDRSVMNYLLLNSEFSGRVVSAGCSQSLALYVAFAPQQGKGAERAAQLDRGIVTLRQSGELARILAKYGLQDWSH